MKNLNKKIEELKKDQNMWEKRMNNILSAKLSKWSQEDINEILGDIIDALYEIENFGTTNIDWRKNETYILAKSNKLYMRN